MSIDEWLDVHFRIYESCPTNYDDARTTARRYMSKQARFTVAGLLSAL